MSLSYFDSIRYGSFDQIEVLVDPETLDLWISQPAIERMLDFPSDTTRKKLQSKSFKSFASKDLTLGKKVVAKDTLGRPHQVKAIPFDTFLLLVYWQCANQNQSAIRLLVAGFADSFRTIALEQCGIKVELSARQKAIQQYLTQYHDYQDWIRDTHIKMYGRKPAPDYYRQIAVAINESLFDRSHFNRDRLHHATDAQLRDIECFERFAMRKKDKYCDRDPLDVTKLLLAEYS